MIKLENVSFKYKNSNNILDDLSFEVKEGEMVAIVGQNGSGKSTLGKLISGILKPKKGKITIDNLDIKSKEAKNKIGIVFQNPENQILFNNLEDEFFFSLKNLKKAESLLRIEQSLKQVEMLKYRKQELYTLSLGQKQRIVIGEVLARKPKYIVFDEPTTMIDSLGKEKIYNIISSLKEEGYTLICITNVSDEILMADRTLILKNGKIAYDIKKEELLDKTNILKENGIQEPFLIQILNKLKEKNIILNMKKFTIDELIYELEGKIKIEECN